MVTVLKENTFGRKEINTCGDDAYISEKTEESVVVEAGSSERTALSSALEITDGIVCHIFKFRKYLLGFVSIRYCIWMHLLIRVEKNNLIRVRDTELSHAVFFCSTIKEML